METYPNDGTDLASNASVEALPHANSRRTIAFKKEIRQVGERSKYKTVLKSEVPGAATRSETATLKKIAILQLANADEQTESSSET